MGRFRKEALSITCAANGDAHRNQSQQHRRRTASKPIVAAEAAKPGVNPEIQRRHDRHSSRQPCKAAHALLARVFELKGIVQNRRSSQRIFAPPSEMFSTLHRLASKSPSCVIHASALRLRRACGCSVLHDLDSDATGMKKAASSTHRFGSERFARNSDRLRALSWQAGGEASLTRTRLLRKIFRSSPADRNYAVISQKVKIFQ